MFIIGINSGNTPIYVTILDIFCSRANAEATATQLCDVPLQMWAYDCWNLREYNRRNGKLGEAIE